MAVPEVTIVVPTYNSTAFLAQTLESVFRQTVDEWELVVVDDGSSDGTPAVTRRIISHDPRCQLIELHHEGANEARNSGALVASPDSPHLIFLDADDQWEEDALENLLKCLARWPEAVAAYGLATCMDEYGKQIRQGEVESWCRDRVAPSADSSHRLETSAPTTFGVLAVANRIPTPGQVLIRRWAYQAAGGFRPEAGHAADWELWLRLALLGDLAFLDRVLLRGRQHAAQMSREGTGASGDEHEVRRRLLDGGSLSPEQELMLKDGFRLNQLLYYQQRLVWLRQALIRGDLITAAKQARHALKAYSKSVVGWPEHSLT